MTVHVPADLPAEAPCRIAWVGEAPGSEEVNPITGVPRPLIGPSGRIFDAMLRTGNIERTDHWVGNVFDEKLPENNVAAWCSGMEEKRTWGEDYRLPPIGRAGFLRPEYLWHLDRLRAELEAVQPTLIVPMGATALWAFTGTDEIGKARGHVEQATRIMRGTKVLPTYHPAFVMKSWKFFTVGVADMIKADAESYYPEVRHRARKLYIEPSLKDLEEWRPKLLQAPYLSVDIETGWGHLTCISFAPSPVEAICVPFVDLRKPNKSYWPTAEDELKAWDWVQELMESPIPKVGQFFQGYDAFWLLAKYGIRTMNLRDDTRLLHHALFPELPKDLGFLAARYENVGPWKRMRVGKGAKRDE